MHKKLITILSMTVAVLLAFTVMASAAPNVMYGCPDSEGLLYIDIYNPETVVSTTTQKDYVLSGVAKSGAVVSVYYLDKTTGAYNLAYTDGCAAVQTIGASGYFAQRISLAEGKNNILVRVDSSYASEVPSQVVQLEINLLVDSFWNSFRSTSANMFKALGDLFS